MRLRRSSRITPTESFMSSSNDDRTLRIFEIVVATLLGLGALGGAWAGYQANQWGSSAIENFGKSSTTATRGAALYNQGVATANRDAELDDTYMKQVLAAGEAKFADADKIFAEGSAFSARSTAFGIVGMMFTVTLFLAGISLVLKSNVKWVFSFIGYGSLIAAGFKLFA